MRFPRITPRRIIMDLSLTCVVATQLWHHIYLGGGLCDLPVWSPMTPREGDLECTDLTGPRRERTYSAPAPAR